MWQLKAIGAAMILAGSIVLGLQKSKKEESKIRTLQDIKYMLVLLKGEMIYERASLPDIYLHLSQKLSKPYSGFFLKLCEEMEHRRGRTMEEIWREEVEKSTVDWTMEEKDRQEFLQLGNFWGYIDISLQESALELYKEKLDYRIEDMQGTIKDRQRIYSMLGVLSGLFLDVLLF